MRTGLCFKSASAHFPNPFISLKKKKNSIIIITISPSFSFLSNQPFKITKMLRDFLNPGSYNLERSACGHDSQHQLFLMHVVTIHPGICIPDLQVRMGHQTVILLTIVTIQSRVSTAQLLLSKQSFQSYVKH